MKMKEGKIFLSCGHEDHKKPLGWGIYERDWDVDGETLVYSTVCTSCFASTVLSKPEDCWLEYNEAWEAIFGQT